MIRAALPLHGLGRSHLPQGRRSSSPPELGSNQFRPGLGRPLPEVRLYRMTAHCSRTERPSTVHSPASCGGSRHVGAQATCRPAPAALSRAARAPASPMRLCCPQSQCKPVPKSNISSKARSDGDLGHRRGRHPTWTLFSCSARSPGRVNRHSSREVRQRRARLAFSWISPFRQRFQWTPDYGCV